LGRRVANRIGDPHHQRLALDVSFPVAGREVGEIMRQVGKIGIEICKKLIDGGINMMKVLNRRCAKEFREEAVKSVNEGGFVK